MIKQIIYLITIVLFSSTMAFAAEQKSAGGISFEVPQGWIQTEPRSSMRLFQFEVTSPETKEPGVMAVFYFGPGQGGAIDANVERWKSQFTPGEGDAAPEIVKSTFHDVAVTTVYLEGTYDGGMGQAGPKSDYAALGAIAEGKKGPVFFKLTGPKPVIEQARSDFENLISGNSKVSVQLIDEDFRRQNRRRRRVSGKSCKEINTVRR